jgi:hypothetical protein
MIEFFPNPRHKLHLRTHTSLFYKTFISLCNRKLFYSILDFILLFVLNYLPIFL